MEPIAGKRSRKTNKREEEIEQWGDSDSGSSYTSISSISSDSDSSEGHIILGRNIPRPNTYMSAPETQKRKESNTAIVSGGSSQPSLSSSSQFNQLIGMPGYDPNRIPASVFSTKPINPMEWSLASNESLFSIHMGNFSFSGDQALAVLLKSGEILKRDGSVKHKTDIIPVLPSVKESESFENKPDEPVKNKLESESDDEEIKEESEPTVMAETLKEEEEEHQEEENERSEDKVDDHDDGDDRDDNDGNDDDNDDDGEVKKITQTHPSNVSHSTSISCRSDTSNNSNCSFAFPVMENDEIVKTPSMQTKKDGSKPPLQQQQEQEQEQSQSLYNQTQTQIQTQSLHEPQTQMKPSKKNEDQTQSLKPPRFRRCFSCFYFPPRCCLFM